MRPTTPRDDTHASGSRQQGDTRAVGDDVVPPGTYGAHGGGTRLVPPVARGRIRAATVALAPAVLLAALAYHPYIADLTDKASVAAALTSDTTRWGFSHLAVGVAAGLLLLAFLAVRSYLREAGEEHWSVLALPFIAIGSVLFAFLPAMEIAMLAVAEEGADVQAILIAMDSWFFPILLAGAVLFALGVLGFATSIVRSGVLSPGLRRLVVVALIVMAATRFAPVGAALYLGGVAGVVALWVLAVHMWRHPAPRG